MTTTPDKTTMVAESVFRSYPVSVGEALDALDARTVLARQERVLVKPNLVLATPHPVTTPPACVEAIIAYVRACSGARIVIAEGTGDATDDTPAVFDALGYTTMARRLDIELVDLNTAETVTLSDPTCRVFPTFHLPVIATTHFIISVPVLKAHSLAMMTGSMKNMMGFAPPRHYQQGGHWKKSAFHARMHESLIELNRYRSPDLSVMDATVGLRDHHLGGAHCSPPVNRILASRDARALDRRAAELLGLEWRRVPHLV
jgi:uncharacterized protein (DUF362 family)